MELKDLPSMLSSRPDGRLALSFPSAVSLVQREEKSCDRSVSAGLFLLLLLLQSVTLQFTFFCRDNYNYHQLEKAAVKAEFEGLLVSQKEEMWWIEECHENMSCHFQEVKKGGEVKAVLWVKPRSPGQGWDDKVFV